MINDNKKAIYFFPKIKCNRSIKKSISISKRKPLPQKTFFLELVFQVRIVELVLIDIEKHRPCWNWLKIARQPDNFDLGQFLQRNTKIRIVLVDKLLKSKVLSGFFSLDVDLVKHLCEITFAFGLSLVVLDDALELALFQLFANLLQTHKRALERILVLLRLQLLILHLLLGLQDPQRLITLLPQTIRLLDLLVVEVHLPDEQQPEGSQVKSFFVDGFQLLDGRRASEQMFFLYDVRKLDEVVVDGGEQFRQGLRGRFSLLVGVVAVVEDRVAAVDEQRHSHLLEQQRDLLEHLNLRLIVLVPLLPRLPLLITHLHPLINQHHNLTVHEHDLLLQLIIVLGAHGLGLHLLQDLDLGIDS